MNWMEEQIRLRVQKDDEAFEEACERITAAVTLKKQVSLSDEREKIKNAMAEILHFYQIKTVEIPPEIKEFEEQLEYVCRPNGMMHRWVKLDAGWYRDAVGAFLGTKKDGTLVALIPGRVSGYWYYDEERGKKVKITKKNEKELSVSAICFYRPFPIRKMKVADLVNYIRQCVSLETVIKIVLITLGVTLVGMISPKITQALFSTVLDSGSVRVLLSIAVLSICVSVSTMITNGVKSLFMQKINSTMDISVQAATMARLLSLPADFFQQYSAGEITTRAQYINTLCSTLVSTFLSTSLTSLFSLIYIAQIFEYAPTLVLPSICVTVATILVSQIATFAQMKYTKEQMEIAAKKSGMTYSLITGIQKIKLSGSEKRAFSRWLNLYAEEARMIYDTPFFIMFSGIITMAVSAIGTIVMYALAVKSNISVADYYAFTAAYGMVSGAFAAVSGIVSTAAEIHPTIEMAKPILEAVPEITKDKKVVTKLSGGVELNNVSFRYQENMPLVIDDLSLKIRPGQYVAIVGKTGCGKSTLVRLLLGFETPQKGAIYYDGRDISTLDLRSLRRKIGTVMQDSKLFQADVFSNIIISAPQLSMEDAWEAAELADIADDIKAMPMGMQTMITEGSGGISGGQKQRLIIARAIAPKPKMLIFDEATSALDNITQKKVSKALDGLKCTRIVIAHRLSTIKQCDRIIYLEDGKIAEDGTYEELLALNGKFAELVEKQRVDI